MLNNSWFTNKSFSPQNWWLTFIVDLNSIFTVYDHAVFLTAFHNFRNSVINKINFHTTSSIKFDEKISFTIKSAIKNRRKYFIWMIYCTIISVKRLKKCRRPQILFSITEYMVMESSFIYILNLVRVSPFLNVMSCRKLFEFFGLAYNIGTKKWKV